MGTDKTLRFRPAVVLCVGEEGRAVGAQLEALLADWAEAGDPRRGGIAVLEVGAHPAAPAALDPTAPSDELAGGWMDARLDAEGMFGGPRRAGDVPLRRLIVEALRGRSADDDDPGRVGVLDDRVVWSIEESGYVVPRAMVVVWIVAPAASPQLLSVAREVRRGLSSERIDNWVLLALPNAYPRDPEQHAAQSEACANQPWQELLVSDNGGAPLATYAYVFETQSERGTFWEHEDDVAFATAEAIFVMTASGITTTREYEDMLRRSAHHMVQDPFERMSGVGTSRLLFPRAQVEQYCANQLGADLLQLWARSEEVGLAPATASDGKASARAVVAELRRQIGDDPSISRGGRASPRASAEAMSRARPLPRPAADGGLIFRHLGQSELDRLADGKRDLPSRMAAQREKAEEGFAIWALTIRPGWERAERSIDRAITTTAGELVLEGPGGVARARAYLDETRRLLVAERDRLVRQRETRALGYGRFLDRMELAAQGPWLAEQPRAPQPLPAVPVVPMRVVPQSAPRPAVPPGLNPWLNPGLNPALGASGPVPAAPRIVAPRASVASSSYPPYSSYPPRPANPATSYPATPYPNPGVAPVPQPFTPGGAPDAAPGIVPASYTPTGYTPPGYVSALAPAVPWADSDSSGPWRLVYTYGPVPPSFGPYAGQYAPAASGPVADPYAPPLTGPLSYDTVTASADDIFDPARVAGALPRSQPLSAPYSGSLSASVAAPLSQPISEPALPTIQRRPADSMRVAASRPISTDPTTNPGTNPGRFVGAVTFPPTERSEPISARPGARELQPPPLPAYLAPSAPALPFAPVVIPSAGPVIISAEPPSLEERLIADLATRVRFYETRRPKAAALAGVSLAALAPLVFLAQALVPAAWLARPFGMIGLTLAVAALVALAAITYASMRARQVGDAVADLRAVYARSFADRCERHEDERREAVVAGLVARVRRMLDRLSQWDTFASTMAETMQREAVGVERALFEGPLGRRNVLLANRRRLHPLSYRLANLEVDVSTKRRRRPLESSPWHSDLSAMLPKLRRELRGGVSLLEADPTEVVVPIRTFCTEVVRPYLSGDIAELGAAFETLAPEEETTYLDAMMERSAILYRPADPPRNALAFVAARDEHQTYVSGKKQPSEPITLQIEDRGWLGVLRLFPGGSLPTFGMTPLARRVPVLSRPTWSSGAAGTDMRSGIGRGQGMGMGMGAASSMPFAAPPTTPASRPLIAERAPDTVQRARRPVVSASPAQEVWPSAENWQPRTSPESGWLLDGTGDPTRLRRQS